VRACLEVPFAAIKKKAKRRCILSHYLYFIY
jgi:hypothetical protein